MLEAVRTRPCAGTLTGSPPNPDAIAPPRAHAGKGRTAAKPGGKAQPLTGPHLTSPGALECAAPRAGSAREEEAPAAVTTHQAVPGTDRRPRGALGVVVPPPATTSPTMQRWRGGGRRQAGKA